MPHDPRMGPSLIHEDAALLVLEKPAGMPAVAVQGRSQGTLAEWILERYPSQEGVGEAGEAGLVHRLDNDTSGLILAGRTQAAYDRLRRQFDAASVRKEYLALVVGAAPERGECGRAIAHHPRKRDRMAVCESRGREAEWKGRPALTAFEAIGRFTLPSQAPSGRTFYTLLSVTIATGVRHQIRAHLAHLGYPVAGDALYANARARQEDALGLTRHFLHASRLVLRHPEGGEMISFESPLPGDLSAALERLQKRD